MSLNMGYLSNDTSLIDMLCSFKSDASCKLVSTNSYLATKLGQRVGEQLCQPLDGEAPPIISTSLMRWFENHWAQYGNGMTLITSELRDVILSELISSHSTSSIVLQPSTAQLLCRILQWGIKDPEGRGGAALQLSPLIKDYRKRIAQLGFIETGEACIYLEKTKYNTSDTIVFHELDDVQPALARLIGKLPQKGSSIWFVYRWSDSEFMREYQHKLVSAIGVVESTAYFGSPRQPSQVTALCALQRNLYQQSFTMVARDDSVEFLGADCLAAEHFSVVNRVNEEIRAGVRSDKIAVLYRNLAPLAENLVNGLMSKGIEVALDLSLPVSSTRLGQALLTLLAAATDESAGEVSVSAYVLSAYSAFNLDEAIEIDRALRKKRLRGRSAVRYIWARAHKAEQHSITVDEAVDKVMRYTKRASANEWASIVDSLLSTSLGGQQTQYQKDMDAAAHKAIVQALSQLELVEKYISASGLLHALNSVQAHITPWPGSTGVLVADMDRARGRVFDTVILGGLSSDAFQRRTDYSAQDLVAAAYGVTPLLHNLSDGGITQKPLEQESYFHCQLLHMASRRIVCACQHRITAGEKALPSSFLEEVVSHIAEEASSKAKSGAVQDMLSELLTANYTSAVDLELIDEESFHTASKVISAVRPVEDKASLPGLVADGLILSPSQVESVLFCPYYWFLSRVVGGEEIDSDISHKEMGTVAHFILQQVFNDWIGAHSHPVGGEDVSAVTAMVDNAVLKFINQDKESLDDDILIRQSHLLKDVYENDPHSFARLIAGIKRLIREEPHFVEFIGPRMRPVLTELKLGYGSDLHLQGTRMRGTIDRVDSDGDSAIIVDYKGKSDSFGIGETQVKRGFIQNALYIRMLQQAIQNDEVPELRGNTVEGAFYRGYRADAPNRGIYRPESIPGKSQGVQRKNMDYDLLLERVDERLRLAIERIREGVIATAGRKNEKCRYCPHVLCEYWEESHV